MQLTTITKVVRMIFKICCYVFVILFGLVNYHSCIKYRGEFKDISCHKEKDGDILPAAKGKNFSVSVKTIFFIETSCKRGINSRQACAIESAAKANPNWHINIMIVGPVMDVNTETFTKLKQMNNVKFSRIHITEYFKDTPLESLLKSNVLQKSKWPVHHTADILRYLTLYKWGGVYLDLDVVVVKSFDTLPSNWAAKEFNESMGAGALALSNDKLGRQVAGAAIRTLKRWFNPKSWSYNSVGVIGRALTEICSTSKVANMSAATCQGFQLYQPELFYPIPYNKHKLYFDQDKEDINIENSYVHHMWNKLSYNLQVPINSRYTKLAKRFCPVVYALYRSNFGS